VMTTAFQAKENPQSGTSPIGALGAAIDTPIVAGQLLECGKIFGSHFQRRVGGNDAVFERVVAVFRHGGDC